MFAAIFDLAEDAPDVSDPNAFWEYAKDHNVRTLGTSRSESSTVRTENLIRVDDVTESPKLAE